MSTQVLDAGYVDLIESLGQRRTDYRIGAHEHQQGIPGLGERREAPEVPVHTQAHDAIRDVRHDHRSQGVVLQKLVGV